MLSCIDFGAFTTMERLAKPIFDADGTNRTWRGALATAVAAWVGVRVLADAAARSPWERSGMLPPLGPPLASPVHEASKVERRLASVPARSTGID